MPSTSSEHAGGLAAQELLLEVPDRGLGQRTSDGGLARREGGHEGGEAPVLGGSRAGACPEPGGELVARQAGVGGRGRPDGAQAPQGLDELARPAEVGPAKRPLAGPPSLAGVGGGHEDPRVLGEAREG